MDELQFRWTWLGADVGGREVVYQLGQTHIARLIDRVDGSWFVRLDTHLPGTRTIRNCTSYEMGRRGVELWAARHAERLREQVAAKHEAWLSRQLWRPREVPEGATQETRHDHDTRHAEPTTPLQDQSRMGRRPSKRYARSRLRASL